MQVTLAALGLLSSVVAWLAGECLVAHCWNLAWQCHSFHPGRDSAYQQAIVEPDLGQGISSHRSAAHTLGRVTCLDKVLARSHSCCSFTDNFRQNTINQINGKSLERDRGQ